MEQIRDAVTEGQGRQGGQGGQGRGVYKSFRIAIVSAQYDRTKSINQGALRYESGDLIC